MRAILSLVLAYGATPPLRILAIAGIAVILLSFATLAILPQSTWTLMIPLAGAFAFFLGSALMPLIFGQLAQGRQIYVLPFGRLKLLTSVYVTVTLVALPTPLLEFIGSHYALNLQTQELHGATASHIAIGMAVIERSRLGAYQNFWLTLTGSFLVTSGLYLTLWFITRQRSIAGYVKGLLVVLFMMYSPGRLLTRFSITPGGSLMQISSVFLIFGVGFLSWPQWQATRLRLHAVFEKLGSRLLHRSPLGREADVVLGTSNPWLLIAAQVVPIVFASTIGFYSAAIWLFYLTIFSTVAGAIACHAAERSRILWLRGEWSRSDLFTIVERSFWRHNSFVLGSLIALMIGIGSYASLPVVLLAAGLPLLLISTVLSTYLGLMVTRSLRIPEALLAVIVMLALMSVAVLAARSESSKDIALVAALEVFLALAVVPLRSAAKSRWASIDWLLCRADRAARMRAAA
jgi:hypothetical protein